MSHLGPCAPLFVALVAATISCGPAEARSAPTIDTEDGTLGSVTVGRGRIHPIIGIDLRNGDFARGNYDDDRADLNRMPVHIRIGISADLHVARDGTADSWLVVSASNGFHAPSEKERTPPRSWYESNSLIGLVTTPIPGLRAAAIYTIKASPNGISKRSHEASLGFAITSKSFIGTLRPSFVATVRAKGDHGLYTQIGIEPQISLAPGDDAARLSLPAAIGIGWQGFYRTGSGDRMYGHAGFAMSKPFAIARTRWNVRFEILAMLRDRQLARLSGPDGETDSVVPLATLGLTLAY